jgi:hypothetical protein
MHTSDEKCIQKFWSENMKGIVLLEDLGVGVGGSLTEC